MTTTNKEILDKLIEHGEVLARLDERTENMSKLLEKQDGRVTHLERRDMNGTIFSGVISGITAVIVAIHAYLSN